MRQIRQYILHLRAILDPKQATIPENILDYPLSLYTLINTYKTNIKENNTCQPKKLCYLAGGS